MGVPLMIMKIPPRMKGLPLRIILLPPRMVKIHRKRWSNLKGENHMQKIKIIVFCLVTALALAACGSEKKSDEKISADVEKNDRLDDKGSTDEIADIDNKDSDGEKNDHQDTVADDKDADDENKDVADALSDDTELDDETEDSSNADTGDKNADNKTGDTGGTEKSREQIIIESLTLEYASQGNLNNNKIITLSAELRELNPDKADKWDSIMKLWKGLDDSLVINYDILPDGLPETNELCIVVLGFQLNADGTMKDELLQRLTVAKASAEKYPNAYVVCTGGGTAAQNKSVTEAGEMAKWLIKNGIDEKRVIVENKSLTTAHNAIYTLAILGEKYPEVNSIVIVSSDYHIKTGWLLFSAEATLLAEKAGEERIKVISDAAWHAPSGSLTNIFNARALAALEEYIEKANAI